MVKNVERNKINGKREKRQQIVILAKLRESVKKRGIEEEFSGIVNQE